MTHPVHASKSTARHLLKVVAAGALAAAFATNAAADFHTYKIEQIYSNPSGTVQFVVLHEALGEDGQQFWSGHAFSTTSHTGAPLTNYVFPSNISKSFVTHDTRALIASAGFASLGLVAPDYVLPNGFLDPAGGRLNYGDVDVVTYGALPTVGAKAIDRTGTAIQNVATNFAGASASVGAQAFAINPGITGAWFDPKQSGHGLFLEVLPPNGLMAFWFTFNPDGTQQAWFGGVGSYAGNIATVPVALTTGGRWIPNFDASKVVNNPWGTLTFTFTDCNSGRVDFTSSIPGYGSNHMDLARLTSPAGLTCP